MVINNVYVSQNGRFKIKCIDHEKLTRDLFRNVIDYFNRKFREITILVRVFNLKKEEGLIYKTIKCGDTTGEIHIDCNIDPTDIIGIIINEVMELKFEDEVGMKELQFKLAHANITGAVV